MPKLKTHKGARKRFKITANGKVKAKRAGGRHLQTGKSRNNTRKNQGMAQILTPVEAKKIKTLLAGARH
jgi:large subunit ribosomal protein L35